MVKEKQAGKDQYLTFKLGEEVYALEIINVREVLDYTKITKVPNMPEFLKGVINLRGGVVPVVDLRLKFGMAATEFTVDTCIIIVEVHVDDELTVLGALADQVKEVVEMNPGAIEPPPRIGGRLDTEFIRGMGKQDDEFIIILNIEKIFSLRELAMVQQVSGSADAPPEEEQDNTGGI